LVGLRFPLVFVLALLLWIGAFIEQVYTSIFISHSFVMLSKDTQLSNGLFEL
jgi:hypothetical protein